MDALDVVRASGVALHLIACRAIVKPVLHLAVDCKSDSFTATDDLARVNQCVRTRSLDGAGKPTFVTAMQSGPGIGALYARFDPTFDRFPQMYDRIRCCIVCFAVHPCG